MRRRQDRIAAAPFFVAATVSYAANCALGTAVATRVVDTSGYRWLHHALYIATCTTVAVAVAAGWFLRPRAASRRAALTLLPAAAPLAVIPFAGTHRRRHPVIALAAAPFIVAGLLGSLRPADRK
ncbi:hypothetical protein [Microbacterium paludicola]|uniref:hypothetical protein n=1 Tax=Microbacterium paludicola TaxID=300019 RepID=UPI0011A49D3B|nr:hypothetical protein [Microbacterium paludicola]